MRRGTIPRSMYLDPRIVQLDNPFSGTPLLPRSRLSSSEVWIQISLCDSQSAPPIPPYFFSRLGRQRNRWSRRLCFCQRVLVFGTAMQLWVSQPRNRAARISGMKSNSRSSRILWSNCFAVSARSNLSWAKHESLMHAVLNRVPSSFFRIGLFLFV